MSNFEFQPGERQQLLSRKLAADPSQIPAINGRLAEIAEAEDADNITHSAAVERAARVTRLDAVRLAVETAKNAPRDVNYALRLGVAERNLKDVERECPDVLAREQKDREAAAARAAQKEAESWV